MTHNILDGRWKVINSESEHTEILKGHRIQVGDYVGPGRYMYFHWQQRCPRNCCYDDCAELIPAKLIIEKAKEQMTELADVLRIARKKI